jgi:two-component system chemotaxis sensor kinase CheA
MNLDAALQTFIVESRELLESMEDALLRIEQSPDDADTINAIFRAAHTIKGSAGLFGLDDIVAFTHVAESVLDKVRSGELAVNADMATTLLAGGDYIRELVDGVANGTDMTDALREKGQALVNQLNTYLGIGATPAAKVEQMPVEYELPHTTQGGGEVETDLWHISLRFGRDVLKSGMDPLSFIRYLCTLGDIEQIVTLLNSIPTAPEMDPESCYLGFEISFKSQADKATIENVFEFVREDSEIRILPPHSKINEYLRVIADLPVEDMRVGEILVRCGTLTSTELENALRLQSEEEAASSRPLGQMLMDAQVVQAPVMAAALEKQKQIKEHKSNEAHLIRVDADKLDQLINLVGELIIAGAGASLIAQRAGVSDLHESMATLSRLVEEVRDSALNLRMVQIGATFNRFQRVVRDPLTHLVRNSMDHGIEPADVRLARGKPAKGTLQLNAFHDAGSIVIEVSDDGGGLNKERILKKAVERGLVTEGATLSDKDIYNLIFEAGFSTADAVSNLSGRGVGMDVVRRNIQALRGTVDLDSVDGQGSTVRIRLPLTLAIIDGFLVGVGNAAYVIPLDMVVECIELSASDSNSADKRYLNLRGEVLPYCRLREHFEVEGQTVRRENVVVVRYGDQKVGLVVDKLMGEFQTVIKPLGKVFHQTQGLGGFTILGSGEVALVLDVPGLMKQVIGNSASQSTGTDMAPV